MSVHWEKATFRFIIFRNTAMLLKLGDVTMKVACTPKRCFFHTKLGWNNLRENWKAFCRRLESCQLPPLNYTPLPLKAWQNNVLWLCPTLPTKTLKWLSSLSILMQKSFRWCQCSDRYIISLSPLPPLSLSLTSLMVSVDVKHHVYLLSRYATT